MNFIEAAKQTWNFAWKAYFAFQVGEMPLQAQNAIIIEGFTQDTPQLTEDYTTYLVGKLVERSEGVNASTSDTLETVIYIAKADSSDEFSLNTAFIIDQERVKTYIDALTPQGEYLTDGILDSVKIHTSEGDITRLPTLKEQKNYIIWLVEGANTLRMYEVLEGILNDTFKEDTLTTPKSQPEPKQKYQGVEI